MNTAVQEKTNLKKVITSINPATLEPLGEVAITDEPQVREAVARARDVAPAWATLSFKERAQHILNFRNKVREQIDDLAKLISTENGKPLAESVGSDLMPVMDLCTYFAKNAERLLQQQGIWLGKWSLMGRSSTIDFVPLGVIGIISPWNYPFSIPAGQCVMALIAGNTVVLKPSEYTPLIGEKIGALFKEAGFPEHVMQVVSGDGSTGAALIQSGVNKISFTGSVNTGKKIMAAAAESLTPITLELGGKDPMIVLEDADLDVASSAAVWGAFTNNGQVCASVERLYVDEKIAKDFEDQVVEKVKKLVQAKGTDYDADVSVLNNEAQLKVVTEQVDAALAAGAKALTGGKRLEGKKGYFYPPTVLTDVTHEMKVVKEETFGPVLPIMTFKTQAEAIRLSNDSPYGLTASVWTKDIKKGKRLAAQLESGTVTVNENVYTYALAQTPWGGPKWSGIGRTHGKMGLLEMVEPRHIHVNRAGFMKDMWWYKYNETKYKFLVSFCEALFAPGFGKLKGLAGMLSRIWRLKNT
jgi:acyl-CoA reductase-like NAD-dependent aldehyde dehydrogenase